MKRPVIISIFAVLLAVGCIKNDAVGTADQEIVFDTPVLSVATKAAASQPSAGAAHASQPLAKAATEIANNFPTDGEFNVFAHYHQTVYTTFAAGQPYMDNVTVAYDPSQGTNGGWKASPSYYWPKNGSLTFAAYYPSDADAEAITYGESGFTIENFTVADNAEDQVDLLVSERAYDQTVSDQKDRNPHYYGVQLNFLHTLSSIVFKLKAEEALVGEKSLGYEFRIRKIEVLNAYGTGSFSQNIPTTGEKPKTPDAKASDWTCDPDSEKDYVAYEGSSLIIDSTTPTASVDTDANQTNLILLPQSLDHGTAKVKVKVTYDLRHSIMEEGVYVEDNVVETEMTTSEVSTWLRGKRYVYTLTIGLEEIRLSPKVTDWKDNEGLTI